jgi:hypothetical protein
MEIAPRDFFDASIPITADHSALGPFGMIFSGTTFASRSLEPRAHDADLVAAFSRDRVSTRVHDQRRN